MRSPLAFQFIATSFTSDLGMYRYFRGRGLKSLTLPRRFIISRAASSRTDTLMSTVNSSEDFAGAPIELDDAVANFIHRYQRLTRGETTQASAKNALNGLLKPAVCTFHLCFMF
jgi:hypothetical protein